VSVLEGRGLHGGAFARVRFLREPGPVRLRSGGAEAAIDELVFDGAARSTRASSRDGALSVGTVEHLFAALGAASVREGLVVEIDGAEVPLLDGGACAFLDALVKLDPPRSGPRLVVAGRGAIEVGESRYELLPSDGVRVEVEIVFEDERLERVASWGGDLADFRDRIAPARTFAFERDLDELLARGLASHVAPESVVLFTPSTIHCAGRPFEPDEPARHKLLDLVGDLYAHGGPPLGYVRAIRPGHAVTHEVVRRALAEGLLVVHTSGDPSIHPEFAGV
jgi:UDP-3-O-[3-hydroxymyristoyl] N-acetylglucosamine deacetylase